MGQKSKNLLCEETQQYFELHCGGNFKWNRKLYFSEHKGDQPNEGPLKK